MDTPRYLIFDRPDFDDGTVMSTADTIEEARSNLKMFGCGCIYDCDLSEFIEYTK